ncbi:MAG TPA: HupE/UreJ family protein [Steroidobacteraceae bacterium]|nr:HupE/UreJ family protein [Steroidobacteraceae bacterium]
MSDAPVDARTRARLAIGFVLAFLSLVAPITAQSHATSTSYLIAHDTGDGTVTLTWDVAVPDVHWSLDLDADGDGAITWREIEARRDDIASLAASHLRIGRAATEAERADTRTSHTRQSQLCTPRLEDMLLTEHAGEPHLSLTFTTACDATGPLALSATLFFDKDATQRTLIDVTTPAGQFTGILSPGAPEWREPAAPSLFATFGTFIGQGLWHVWIGYDHLAFLLLLLLPGVLRSTGTDWRGTRNFGETARDLLRIVTAFTVAHSVTLALAATGTVHVPVRPVEISIALSIVVAGLLNLFPAAARARLALAFGFGLIHGFGFANALAELGTHGTRLVPTLAGFNVGVELAQVSLVILVLPFLLRARHSLFYAWRFMPVASIGAAMAGAAWLAARGG